MLARVSRSLIRRDVNWARLGGKIQDEAARAELSRLQGLFSEMTSRATTGGAKEAAPIDWPAYKAKAIAPEVVEYYEAAYNALQFPATVSFADLAVEAEDSYKVAASEARDMIANAKTNIARLEKELAAMEAQRVTKDTSMQEVLEANPDIADEIYNEINEYEFNKDILH